MSPSRIIRDIDEIFRDAEEKVPSAPLKEPLIGMQRLLLGCVAGLSTAGEQKKALDEVCSILQWMTDKAPNEPKTDVRILLELKGELDGLSLQLSREIH